ncbi:hypothetical protein HispidOSU_013080, partial [Sigmodon hispidus]
MLDYPVCRICHREPRDRPGQNFTIDCRTTLKKGMITFKTERCQDGSVLKVQK